jgi:hypothetical protein
MDTEYTRARGFYVNKDQSSIYFSDYVHTINFMRGFYYVERVGILGPNEHKGLPRNWFLAS